MEQVEGGDLVVNKGKEFKPRDKGAPRNMNAMEGVETALRLAEVGYSVFCNFHYLISLYSI